MTKKRKRNPSRNTWIAIGVGTAAVAVGIGVVVYRRRQAALQEAEEEEEETDDTGGNGNDLPPPPEGTGSGTGGGGVKTVGGIGSGVLGSTFVDSRDDGVEVSVTWEISQVGNQWRWRARARRLAIGEDPITQTFQGTVASKCAAKDALFNLLEGSVVDVSRLDTHLAQATGCGTLG